MDNAKIGKFIAELRKSAGLSQTELAKELNISNRTVSKWETGDGLPDIATVPQIAQFFGITVDELLAGERKPSVAQEAAPNPVAAPPQPSIPQPIPILYQKTFTENVREKAHSVRAALSKKSPKWCGIVTFICLLIDLICLKSTGAEFGINSSATPTILNIAIAADALALALIVFGEYIVAWSSISESKQINGGKKVPETVTFYADGAIILTEGNTTQRFYMKDITGFSVKKDVLAFNLHKNAVFYIPKSAFDENELLSFCGYMQTYAPTEQKNKTAKVLSIVMTVVMIIMTVVMLSGSILLNTLGGSYVDAERFNAMSTDEAIEYIDGHYYDYIEYDARKTDETFKDASKAEKAIYIVEDFKAYYMCDGICAYFCDDGDIFSSDLTSSMREIGLNDAADTIDNFIEKNNIDYSRYKEANEDTEKNKYPYAALDNELSSTFDNQCNEAIAKYAKSHASELQYIMK